MQRRFPRWFARRGAEVTAIDPNPHYVRQSSLADGHPQLEQRIECAESTGAENRTASGV